MNRTRLHELAEELRLAFSYREKVGRLCLHADELLASGALDRLRYEALLGDYAPHVEQAKSAVEFVRSQVRRAYGQSVRQADRAEKRLAAIRYKAAGGGDAAYINTAHRRALADVEEARGVRDGLAALTGAVEAESAGGFMDRPLDVYAAAFTTKSFTSVWHKALPGGTAAAAALFALLLPWMWGAVPRVWAFGFLGALSRLSGSPAPQWQGALPLALVLLPLLAAASLYAARIWLWACWAAVLCAMLMLAAACLPAGWIATRTLAAPTAAAAFAATGPGAWLYAASAFAVVVLAVLAMDRRRGNARLRVVDAVLMAGLALGVFLGLGVLLAYGGERLAVRADIAMDAAGARMVSTLENRGRFSAAVGLLGPAVVGAQPVVSAVVSIRSEPEGPWEVVLPPRQAWRMPGKGGDVQLVELLAGSTQRIELHAGALADAVGRLAAVRLEWHSQGAVLARKDMLIEGEGGANHAP